MRLSVLALPLAAAAALVFPQAHAQSVVDVRATCDTGGIPGCQSIARSVFRVDDSGGIVALGELGIGLIPSSGAGVRLMWHPFKAAFRAGSADVSGQFDDANVGFYSWAGGNNNIAAAIYSFAMGNNNIVQSAAQCGMALGSGNRVYGSGSAIGTCGFAVGLNNDVLDIAGVAIGQNNSSDGDAAVAIGYNSTADADYSMAFGYRASTNGHTGAKVFSDASTTDSLEAGANNEFAVRAAGGFRFRTNATLTTGCSLPAGSGVFSCSSSRLLKENFATIDGADLLARIRALPIETWNYTAEGAEVRHMGPYAEDFRAAFGLGTDDVSIGHFDISGVALAGVQALETRTADLQTENAALAAENAALREGLGALEARLAALEARLSKPAADGGAK